MNSTHHKKNVQVGKDIVEDVEYFEFDYNNNWKSVIGWTLCDTITAPFYRLRYKLKDVYWNIRYGFQRMFKGYDSVDVFDTFLKFICRYEKILKDYKNNHYSHPCDVSEEEWENIIDEMIYHLHYMDEDNISKELEKCATDNLIPSSKSIYEIAEKHKDEFFKLFSEYFYSLCD